MDEASRREAGMAMRRQVLGAAHVDRAAANTTAFNHDFQELITRYAWGEIWTRPGLDVRTRRILAIGTLLALGHWEELRMHVRAALTEGGFTADDVKEVFLHQTLYCGVPAVNHAFSHVADLVRS